MTVTRGGIQGRLAVLILKIDVGTFLQKHFDDSAVPTLRRRNQRDSARVVVYGDAVFQQTLGDGSYHYRLYVQKQPGTRAHPLTLHFELPEGATITSLTLDGKVVIAGDVMTDLRTDRVIELTFRR